MGFNYRTEKKKFDTQWEQLWAEYRAAGMDERSIAEMYAYDLSVFNQRRIIAHREQPFTADITGEHEDESTLFYKFLEQLSCRDCYCCGSHRYSWIEEVTNEPLYMRLHELSDWGKELLTLMAIEGYSRREVGQVHGVTGQAIGQQLQRIGRYLYA